MQRPIYVGIVFLLCVLFLPLSAAVAETTTTSCTTLQEGFLKPCKRVATEEVLYGEEIPVADLLIGLKRYTNNIPSGKLLEKALAGETVEFEIFDFVVTHFPFPQQRYTVFPITYKDGEWLIHAPSSKTSLNLPVLAMLVLMLVLSILCGWGCRLNYPKWFLPSTLVMLPASMTAVVFTTFLNIKLAAVGGGLVVAVILIFVYIKIGNIQTDRISKEHAFTLIGIALLNTVVATIVFFFGEVRAPDPLYVNVQLCAYCVVLAAVEWIARGISREVQLREKKEKEKKLEEHKAWMT